MNDRATPLTDAAEKQYDRRLRFGEDAIGPWEFARQLERSNSELVEVLKTHIRAVQICAHFAEKQGDHRSAMEWIKDEERTRTALRNAGVDHE